MLGDNLGRSNLHLVVDAGGSHVQSTTEEAGEGQSVVDAITKFLKRTYLYESTFNLS
jgi:hypothetical protein